MKSKTVAAGLLLLLGFMVLAWLWQMRRHERKLTQRQLVAAQQPLHDHYMTVQERLQLAAQVQQEAFTQPDDSDIKVKLGKNRGFTLEARIGSKSKYASSFRGKTRSGIPFALRAYAVPNFDRSKIEREGLTRAAQLLQQHCTASMPVVYRCYHTTSCKLSRPFDGPNTGVCHLIVNELANMDAEQWMRSRPPLPQVKAVTFQVLHALFCLLRCSYQRHGDLKASNVLICVEPVSSDVAQYQEYQLGKSTLWVPWTGIRATLWDFEFLKPISLKENPVAETLDSEKVIREMLAFYNMGGRRTQDEVVQHLTWMRGVIHHDQKQSLRTLLYRLFQEYSKQPSGEFVVVETFSAPTACETGIKATN
jgi:hypothetical protein